MTDEQIKQNAVRYQRDLEIETNCILYDDMDVIHTFIAGAHSRDEEIEKLKDRLRFADESIADADKWIAKYKLDIANLEAKLNQLHKSPWISVEEELPERHTPVYAKNNTKTWFFALRTDNRVRPWYNIVGRCGEKVTHWMPIPELNKE